MESTHYGQHAWAGVLYGYTYISCMYNTQVYMHTESSKTCLCNLKLLKASTIDSIDPIVLSKQASWLYARGDLPQGRKNSMILNITIYTYHGCMVHSTTLYIATTQEICGV